MFHNANARSTRNKFSKIKRTLQITLIICVVIWLLYQIKHSYDNKREYSPNVEIVTNENGEEAFLGRKERAGAASFDQVTENVEINNVHLSGGSAQRQDSREEHDVFAKEIIGNIENGDVFYGKNHDHDGNNGIDEGIEVNFDQNRVINIEEGIVNDEKQEGEIESLSAHLDNGEMLGDGDNNFSVNSGSNEDHWTVDVSNGENNDVELKSNENRSGEVTNGENNSSTVEVEVKSDENGNGDRNSKNGNASNRESDKPEIQTDEKTTTGVVRNEENRLMVMQNDGNADNSETPKRESGEAQIIKNANTEIKIEEGTATVFDETNNHKSENSEKSNAEMKNNGENEIDLNKSEDVKSSSEGNSGNSENKGGDTSLSQDGITS